MEIRFEKVRVSRPGFELSVDLALPSGGITAVIGPSGSGKSTLLDLIAGFVTPVAGRVVLGGVDMTGVGPADRPVSMVFQDNNLFPHLDLFRNVALGADPGLRLSQAQRGAVEQVMDEVGLSGLGDRLPGQVSGGQQSRAALARALLRDRPVLLLDEPFSALGPGLRRDMLDLVARLAGERGLTVVMVSHDPEDAVRVAAQTVFVDGGTATGPVETRGLLADPPEALRAYLGG